ncbi:uncharacterized protein F5147DRAFT_656416 [Suillus discolor]|uniref:Uncharacterized protein n=1 Tax=Suillus discolor TaxID=1912936 RepID=A0A9P7EZY8_9AGAM|nr:uncharacterized protein F5147DRAFT_656416 [Suillus discolor]KAG2097284.1 hypothetical protein F5147DRAFT_656416 [Suillus discolor]
MSRYWSRVYLKIPFDPNDTFRAYSASEGQEYIKPHKKSGSSSTFPGKWNISTEHSTPKAAMMTPIAQVGKKRYWQALASCPTFKNRKMWDGLYVLHTDTVDLWNFRDSHKYLHSQEFRAIMMNVVDKIEVGPTVDPTKDRVGWTFGFYMVGTVVSMASALAGSAAPIVVPIAASAALAVWV